MNTSFLHSTLNVNYVFTVKLVSFLSVIVEQDANTIIVLILTAIFSEYYTDGRKI
jgi:hypothetical protein